MHYYRISLIGFVSLLVVTPSTQAKTIDDLSSFEITAPPPRPTVLPSKVGDILFSIPVNVAREANKALEIDPNVAPGCSDGLGDFDAKAMVKPPSVNKRAIPYATAICSSENLIEGVVRGGPLAALQAIDIGGVVVRAAGAAEAYAVVLEYARSVVGELGINPVHLATLAWVLAYEYHEKHYAVQEFNTIPAGDIERSSATQTKTTKCASTLTMCTANCKILGASMRKCSTRCEESTISGACRATQTSGEIHVVTALVTPWTVPPAKRPPPAPSPPAAPSAQCPDDNSGLPAADLIKPAESDYCRLAEGNSKPQTKAYDATGDDFAETPGPFGKPNEINPTLFKIDLTYTPILNGIKCSMSCPDAYRFLSESDCGKKGGDKLSLTGHVDIGCGIYPYSITPPPQLAPRKCYQPFSHGDSRQQEIFYITKALLEEWRVQSIGPGDKGLFIRSKKIKGTVYKISVNWIEGCISTVRPVFVGEPIPGVQMKDLLYENWSKCNNGGAGGSIDAGCLRYAFSPDSSEHDELRRR